jgi:hypothetical protein
MSAFDPKQTILQSLLGVKRTWVGAPHMSAKADIVFQNGEGFW